MSDRVYLLLVCFVGLFLLNGCVDRGMEKGKTYAIFDTQKGEMIAELFKDETPITVDNFVKLAKKGYYDGLTFHRVIPDFVLQAGCPDGTGRGGPGYTIKCETKGEKQSHFKGSLSMAHSGTDTGGSQFFICFNRENTEHLDGYHTVFGRVVKGEELIESVEQGDIIKSIKIEEK